MRLPTPAPPRRLKDLHVCYPPELETYSCRGNRGPKAQDDEHAKNLRYYWLTDEQLKRVTRMPEAFQTFVNATSPSCAARVRAGVSSSDEEPIKTCGLSKVSSISLAVIDRLYCSTGTL
jgi:hypothetical protein